MEIRQRKKILLKARSPPLIYLQKWVPADCSGVQSTTKNKQDVDVIVDVVVFVNRLRAWVAELYTASAEYFSHLSLKKFAVSVTESRLLKSSSTTASCDR